MVDVRGLDQAGRRAVAGLLGVPAVRASMRVDLRELEGIVQAASGLDLATAADRFVPLCVPARRARAQSRMAPVRAGQEWLEDHPAMAARPWTATWLETVRRDVVGGDGGLTEYEVTSALEILAVLREDDDPAPGFWRVRAELAADVVADEQALDEGSAVAVLVVRGLAAAAGWPPPTDAAARRRLWARFGVVPDLVSTTCLALGVAPADPARAGRWEAAAHDGAPVHVTPRDLRDAPGPWRPAVTGWDALLVVDSARVLEAVAGRFGSRVPAVCTDGVPGPTVLDLLGRLHAAGTPLRFVTDFDGPGLALGTLLAERFGARAWRMSVADYRAAARSDLPPVTGRVASPPWAGELAAAMTQAGRAVPAEQVLGEILESLAQELPGDADADPAGPADTRPTDSAEPADHAEPARPADPEGDGPDRPELVTAGQGGAVSG